MALRTPFHKLPIATKVNIVLSSTLAVLFVIAITWATSWLTQRIAEDNIDTVRQVNIQTVNMIQVLNVTLERNVTRLNNILKGSLPPTYTLDTTQRIMVAGTSTPVLKAGNETLNLNFAVVDRFTAMANVAASVLVRDGDDFIRISTSLKKENDERAIGTKLGRDHPALRALLANEPFVGKAHLFRRDYMGHYMPLQDASGAVVGALFVGRDFTAELSTLQQKILEINFGKHGYMYVLDAGDNQGTFIVHPTLQGQNVYDENSIKNFSYIREIIEKENGVLPYQFVMDFVDGEAVTRGRIAVFNSIPEWKWIVVSAIDDEDIKANAIGVRNRLIFGAIVLCALLFAAIFAISRRWIAQPLAVAITSMEKMTKEQFKYLDDI